MIDLADRLRQLISDRSARVGVIGLGYVGLPTAVAFAQGGYHVVGIEPDDHRRARIGGERMAPDLALGATLADLQRTGKLRVEADLAEAGPLDVIDICVPTPLNQLRDPDVSAIQTVASALPPVLIPGQLVCLTSTSYPGTTKEIFRPVLEHTGMVVGRDVFLASTPERIDPGNATYHFRNTPKVVGGVTPTCTSIAAALFATVVDRVIPVSSTAAAETAKLLENTFRSVNIALANEMALICRRLGVNVWEVIDAAASKPFGFMPFYPGPGPGGHCIPIDPMYLSWKLRQLNHGTRFVQLAEEVNRSMPAYVVQRISEILNDHSMSIRGSRILVLGITYKADIDDVRESPALKVVALLKARGAIVEVCDPHVSSSISVGDERLDLVPLDADRLAASDLVVVTTAHRSFDRDLVERCARLVLDTRGWNRAALAREPSASRWHTL